MKKNVAYVNFYGKRLKIASKYRCILCAALAKMYYERVVDRLYDYGRKEIKVVVDVGACIGYYSLFYALAWPDAEIHAFEPSSETFPDLVENSEQFPNIHIYKLAVWDKAEELEIALTTSDQKENMHHLENVGQISVFGKSDNYREKVSAVKLDDMFDRVDYLKIDAEGADMKVLQGAERIIRNHRPVIQIEVSPDNVTFGGGTMAELLEYIHSFGYGIRDFWINDFVFLPSELMTEEERERKFRLSEHNGKIFVQEIVKKEDADTAD